MDLTAPLKTNVVHIDNEAAVLKQELQVKQKELNALLQVTQAVNNNISTQGLLIMFEDLVMRQLGIGKMAVFIWQEKWVCAHEAGIANGITSEIINNGLTQFQQVTRLNRNSNPLTGLFEVVVPVYHKEQPIAFTFLGDFRGDPDILLDEKLNYIQVLSNIVAMAIENKRLFRATTKQHLLKSELEMAGQMQTMLIPAKLPDDEQLSIAGVYLPYQEVGGDYYDYIELNKEEFIFCIGDISGKGVAAALLMANFQASVRSYAVQQPSLQLLIQNLNGRVNEITNGEKFITLFIAKFNYATRELQYVNAGHNPALLFCDGEVQLLQEGCTILGMFEKLPYVHVQSLKLEKQFTAFCYTDGLTDVENEREKTLDLDQVITLIKENSTLPPSGLNKKIVDYLVAFKGTRLINDDVSILTCQVY